MRPRRTSLQSLRILHTPTSGLLTLASSLRHMGINPRRGGTSGKNLGVCLSECGPWANGVGIGIAWGLVSNRRPRASARTRGHGQLGLPQQSGIDDEVETRVLRPEVQHQGAGVVGFR